MSEVRNIVVVEPSTCKYDNLPKLKVLVIEGNPSDLQKHIFTAEVNECIMFGKPIIIYTDDINKVKYYDVDVIVKTT